MGVKVFLFYVDECGDSSTERDPNDTRQFKRGVSPYFTLAAVGIRDSARKPVADALFETKARHFGGAAENEAWGDTELKGRLLRRLHQSLERGKSLDKPSGYSAITQQRVARNLIRDVGLIFDKFRPLVFSVTVDKRRLMDNGPHGVDDPVSAAYALLHERIAFALEKLFTGESAVIIADQQSQHEKKFREGKLNDTRAKLVSHLRSKPDFHLVIDKPLWIDTEHSSWDREIIQLADIVAYSASECAQQGSAPIGEHYLWPQILRSMAVHWRTGSVKQAGFTVFPRGENYYPKVGVEEKENRH